MDILNQKHCYISYTFVTHYIESHSNYNLGFLHSISPLHVTSLLRQFIFIKLISPKLSYILHLSFILNYVLINSLVYVEIVIIQNNNSRNQVLSSRFFLQNNETCQKTHQLMELYRGSRVI